MLLGDEEGLGGVEESTGRPLVGLQRVLNGLQGGRCCHNREVVTVRLHMDLIRLEISEEWFNR